MGNVLIVLKQPARLVLTIQQGQLQVRSGVKFINHLGHEQELTNADLNALLAPLPHYSDGKVRALASLYIEGKPLGGFKYYGRRPDDPNEIAPHEHLRVLRGLYVFCAWLNHTDAKSLNSLDVLTQENGCKFVKHYLLDFGAAFGSDSFVWSFRVKLGDGVVAINPSNFAIFAEGDVAGVD